MNITKSDSPVGQGNSRPKMVGIFKANVVAVSPSQKEIAKLLGIENDKVKDPEYIKENSDGNTQVRVTFWLQEVTTNAFYQVSYYLTDKPSESKEGNPQWINQSGQAFYGVKSDLPVWFTNFVDKDKNVKEEKIVRQALAGEANITDFIRKWLSGANFFDPTTDILLDTNKLLRGNFKELNSLINSEYVGPVVAMATVRVNDEGKISQNVWKEILPGYRFDKWTGKLSSIKDVDFFINNITGEYGPKDYYSLELLHEWDGVLA